MKRLEPNHEYHIVSWQDHDSWNVFKLQMFLIVSIHFDSSFDIFWYLLCVQGLPRFDVRFSETSPAQRPLRPQRPQRRGTPLFLAIFSPWSDRGRTVVGPLLLWRHKLSSLGLTRSSPTRWLSHLQWPPAQIWSTVFICLHLSSTF